MTERLDFAWVYNITPLATFRMLTRLEHLTEQARALGFSGYQILELREREGVFRSVSERKADSELAGWGPRFFSGRNLVRRSEFWNPPSWDGARSCELTVQIDGIPVTANGIGGLAPVGTSTTRYNLSLVVEATGRGSRKLEAGVAGVLARTIQSEYEFSLLWLGRQVKNAF